MQNGVCKYGSTCKFNHPHLHTPPLGPASPTMPGMQWGVMPRGGGYIPTPRPSQYPPIMMPSPGMPIQAWPFPVSSGNLPQLFATGCGWCRLLSRGWGGQWYSYIGQISDQRGGGWGSDGAKRTANGSERKRRCRRVRGVYVRPPTGPRRNDEGRGAGSLPPLCGRDQHPPQQRELECDGKGR